MAESTIVSEKKLNGGVNQEQKLNGGYDAHTSNCPWKMV